MNIEQTLRRIESKIDRLLTEQSPIWISEAEAMKRLGRSKKWLQRERLGGNGHGPSLIFEVDWRYFNGRTPEYKAKSIEERKTFYRSNQDPKKSNSDSNADE
jgi:hypothetical protein